MNDTSHVISTTEAADWIPNQDRRTVLEYLVDHENRSISLEELAHLLAGEESPRFRTDREVPERHAIALHHCHLPKLDEMDVIHYNPGCNTAIFPRRNRDEVAVEVE